MLEGTAQSLDTEVLLPLSFPCFKNLYSSTITSPAEEEPYPLLCVEAVFCLLIIFIPFMEVLLSDFELRNQIFRELCHSF